MNNGLYSCGSAVLGEYKLFDEIARTLSHLLTRIPPSYSVRKSFLDSKCWAYCIRKKKKKKERKKERKKESRRRRNRKKKEKKRKKREEQFHSCTASLVQDAVCGYHIDSHWRETRQEDCLIGRMRRKIPRFVEAREQ